MLQRFLVCPPTYFGTHHLFNPWMTWQERTDIRRAWRQWWALVDGLKAAGALPVFMLPSCEGTGATVFTADGALVYAPGQALVIPNDGLRGESEPDLFRRTLSDLDFQTESLPPGFRLDGGNILRVAPGDWLVGLKPGSTGRAERYLGRLLRRLTGARVWGVTLSARRFLHVDMAFSSLNGEAFLLYPGAFPDGGQDLKRLPWIAGRPVIEVTAEDAVAFGCNAIVVGRTIITGPISSTLRCQVQALGFAVESVDLSEFYKAGGGAKCLTLPLDPLIPSEEAPVHAELPTHPRPAAIGS